MSGKITNDVGEPIRNAEVVVLCWYIDGLDDASFEKQTLTTDKEGNYEVKFIKGYQIDVASKQTDIYQKEVIMNLMTMRLK